MFAHTSLPCALLCLLSTVIDQVAAVPMPHPAAQSSASTKTFPTSWPYISTFTPVVTVTSTLSTATAVAKRSVTDTTSTTATYPTWWPYIPSTYLSSTTTTSSPVAKVKRESTDLVIVTDYTSAEVVETSVTDTTVYTTYTAPTQYVVVTEDAASAAQVASETWGWSSTTVTVTTSTKKSATKKSATTSVVQSTTTSSTTSASVSTSTTSTSSNVQSTTSTAQSTTSIVQSTTSISTSTTLTGETVSGDESSTPLIPLVQVSTISSSIVVATATPSSTAAAAPSATLALSIVNNLGVGNKVAHAYLTGLDTDGVFVMLTTAGTLFYPNSTSYTTPSLITGDVALPLKKGTNTFTVPSYITSARLWFAHGELDFYAVETDYGVGLVEPTVANIDDPSESTSWGFMELTWDEASGLFANLSFVDFVGIPVSMSLTVTDGSGTQAVGGLPSGAVSTICDLLEEQAAEDGQPWGSLCENDADGNLIRVLSPASYISINSSAFADYFTDYVDEVWEYYTTHNLTIRTQDGDGAVKCSVVDDLLQCAGDNRGYAQPTAADIFGCASGTFAIEGTDNAIHVAVVPRLCAAFNRGDLLVKGGHTQPKLHPSKYYEASPNNMYSKFVHQTETDGLGYAFSYDDVAPTGYSVAGIVASDVPDVLTVTIGGALAS